MNEPVAWMYEKPNGASKLSFVKEKMLWEDMTETPLYTQDQLEEAKKLGMQQERALWNLSASTQEIMDTHPVKELNDGGEPVKNATYWKRQYNLMASQNDNLKSGLYHANEQIKYFESQIEALKKDLAKYDELAIDDLNGKRTVWCACGDSIPPNSGALCGNCVSARPSQTLLTMTFEEMYPIAEKHLGHAIGLYNWKIFGDAILKKAQEK